jgi:hypothetical protein
MDDVWVRMDPAHRPFWTDMALRGQPGYVAAPASLLALDAGTLVTARGPLLACRFAA